MTADPPGHAPDPSFPPAPFDGRRFRNASGQGPHGLFETLRWMTGRRRGPWPETIPVPPAPAAVARIDDGTVRASVIGHATVLIQTAGLNILTDPVWSDRVGPTSWLGPRRMSRPALPFSALPPIDAVLVSHNHYDHLDRPSLAAIWERDRPLMVAPRGVARLLPAARTVELDWWQSVALSPRLSVHLVPAEHFSARGLFDRNRTLWGGFVLDGPAGPVYFAGDTGDGPHFQAIRHRFGPMTLSLIPIGAYLPRWFMAPVHIDPEQAVAASLTLESMVTLAIHHSTFPLADDSAADPPVELERVLAALPRPTRGSDFRLPAFGQPVIVGPSGPNGP